MAVDALDPGDDGTYPYFPRNAAGEPLWSDTPEADGVPVDGVTPMPRGLRSQKGTLIDITPRGPGGVAIDPPVRP
jgi:hypothetical protein